MILRLLRALPIMAGLVAVAYGQAAVEYALKSSGGAAAGSGAPLKIGNCRVDSTLPSCFSQSYPRATVVVVALITVLVLWRLFKAHSARR